MQIKDYSFDQDQLDAETFKEHLNPLPRSVVRRKEYELLDGEWRFQLDPDDRGLRERWYLGHEYTGKANWPTSVEAQMEAAEEAERSAAKGQPFTGDDHMVAWYERDFQVPER